MSTGGNFDAPILALRLQDTAKDRLGLSSGLSTTVRDVTADRPSSSRAAPQTISLPLNGALVELTVPPGLYFVEITLPNGDRRQHLVDFQSGDSKTETFEDDYGGKALLNTSTEPVKRRSFVRILAIAGGFLALILAVIALYFIFHTPTAITISGAVEDGSHEITKGITKPDGSVLGPNNNSYDAEVIVTGSRKHDVWYWLGRYSWLIGSISVLVLSPAFVFLISYWRIHRRIRDAYRRTPNGGLILHRRDREDDSYSYTANGASYRFDRDSLRQELATVRSDPKYDALLVPSRIFSLENLNVILSSLMTDGRVNLYRLRSWFELGTQFSSNYSPALESPENKDLVVFEISEASRRPDGRPSSSLLVHMPSEKRGEIMVIPTRWWSPSGYIPVEATAPKKYGTQNIHRLTASIADPALATLLAYMQAGRMIEAASQLRGEALESLLHKNKNPFAAAAGAYVLLADTSSPYDSTAPWRQWIFNLNERYEWLSDAAILVSWNLLQRKQQGDLIAARMHLLRAYNLGLPVFTEGLKRLKNGLMLFTSALADEGVEDEVVQAVRDALRVIDQYSARCNPQQLLTTIAIGEI